MAEHATLILDNDVAELDRVLTLVADLCARHGIPPDTEYDLKLAVDEVVANVARYAYPQGEKHKFTLEVEVTDSEFMARVEDAGKPFDPLVHPTPNLDAPVEERAEGGLGIYLVRQIMTTVDYQRAGGKNILTLRKKLN